MGWINKLIDRIAGVAPTDLTLVPDLPDSGTGIAGKPIDPDKVYVEIYLESLRLAKARRFATTFDGVVYAYARTARLGSPPSEHAAVSRPQNLTSVGEADLDRVIVVQKRLLAVVPWRGDPLGLELGLFSVKTSNLLTPLIGYVTRISELAGIGAVAKVDLFMPLISEGLDMIAGQTQDTELELAIDTDITLGKSMLCALIARPKAEIDSTKLSLDPKDRRLLYDGTPLAAAYCVFSVRARSDNPEWGRIAKLEDAFSDVVTQIDDGKIREAEEALAGFRRKVATSPDLISADKAKLRGLAEEMLKDAFPGGVVSRRGTAATKIRRLEDLDLYGAKVGT